MSDTIAPKPERPPLVLNETVRRVMVDVGVLAAPTRPLPPWIARNGSAAFNAKMEEFAKAVAEECARAVEVARQTDHDRHDLAGEYAAAIREAFGVKP